MSKDRPIQPVNGDNELTRGYINLRFANDQESRDRAALSLDSCVNCYTSGNVYNTIYASADSEQELSDADRANSRTIHAHLNNYTSNFNQ